MSALLWVFLLLFSGFWLVLLARPLASPLWLSQEEKSPDRWALRKVPNRMPKAQVTIIPSSLWYAP